MGIIHDLREKGIWITMGNLNRWTSKGKIVKFEEAVELNGDIKVFEVNSVGAFTYINGGTFYAVDSIGRYCSIAIGCFTGPAEHPTHFLSTSPFQYSLKGRWPTSKLWKAYCDRNTGHINSMLEPRMEETSTNKTITIGNDVWIGQNVTILRGVKIGDGAVIASNSVVTKDVSAYAIVGGVPAKRIRYRFDEEIRKRLLELNWWDYELKFLDNISFNDIFKALNELEERKKSNRYQLLEPEIVQLDSKLNIVDV